MKKQLIITLGLAALTACAQQGTDIPESATIGASATEASLPERSNRSGQVLFDLHCAACHRPGADYAGTKMLALVRDKDKAVIRQRTDLTADYIKTVVTNGLLEMPPFRPTDINEEELDSLANYIISSGQAYQIEKTKNDK